MSKDKISDYSATANSNTDIGGINIDEGCAPSGINDAIRTLMKQLKDFQQGTNSDPFNGPHNGTVGATTPASGAFTTLSATGNVTLGDSSSDTATINATATFAQAANLPNTFGFKNRIINGAMVIDQRNAGASVTPADAAYTLDRWRFSTSQSSKFTVQQSSTAPAGFKNSMLITSTSSYSPTAGDNFGIFQPIEGNNFADMNFGTANAQTITISFWARSSLTGTFSGMLFNSSAGRTYCFTYTINSANTFEYKTVTVAGDTTGTWLTDNGSGLSLYFDLGSGSGAAGTANTWSSSVVRRTSGSVQLVATSGATLYITGVQLEKGSTATSFDYRPYGTELQLCQRYYQTGNISCYKPSSGGSTALVSTQFVCQTRATPSITVLSTSATIGVGWGSGDLITTTSVDFANSTSGEQRQRISFSVSSEL